MAMVAGDDLVNIPSRPRSRVSRCRFHLTISDPETVRIVLYFCHVWNPSCKQQSSVIIMDVLFPVFGRHKDCRRNAQIIPNLMVEDVQRGSVEMLIPHSNYETPQNDDRKSDSVRWWWNRGPRWFPDGSFATPCSEALFSSRSVVCSRRFSREFSLGTNVPIRKSLPVGRNGRGLSTSRDK